MRELRRREWAALRLRSMAHQREAEEEVNHIHSHKKRAGPEVRCNLVKFRISELERVPSRLRAWAGLAAPPLFRTTSGTPRGSAFKIKPRAPTHATLRNCLKVLATLLVGKKSYSSISVCTHGVGGAQASHTHSRRASVPEYAADCHQFRVYTAPPPHSELSRRLQSIGRRIPTAPASRRLAS